MVGYANVCPEEFRSGPAIDFSRYPAFTEIEVKVRKRNGCWRGCAQGSKALFCFLVPRMVQEPRLDTLRLFNHVAWNELVGYLIAVLFGIVEDASFQGRKHIALFHIGKQRTHIVKLHRAIFVEWCAQCLHRVCGNSQFGGGESRRMVENVRLDVLAVLGAFQEQHFHACGIHFDDIGVCLLVEVPPTTYIAVIKPIEFLTLFLVLRLVVRLIIIESVITFSNLNVCFQPWELGKGQVHRVEGGMPFQVREKTDLSFLHDNRAVPQVRVRRREKRTRWSVKLFLDFCYGLWLTSLGFLHKVKERGLSDGAWCSFLVSAGTGGCTSCRFRQSACRKRLVIADLLLLSSLFDFIIYTGYILCPKTILFWGKQELLRCFCFDGAVHNRMMVFIKEYRLSVHFTWGFHVRANFTAFLFVLSLKGDYGDTFGSRFVFRLYCWKYLCRLCFFFCLCFVSCFISHYLITFFDILLGLSAFLHGSLNFLTAFILAFLNDRFFGVLSSDNLFQFRNLVQLCGFEV